MSETLENNPTGYRQQFLTVVPQSAFGYQLAPDEQHQYTSTHINRTIHLQSPAPEDECNDIRNMLSNKNIHKVTSSWFNLFN